MRNSKMRGALSVLLIALVIVPPGAAQVPPSEASDAPSGTESASEEIEPSEDTAGGEAEATSDFNAIDDPEFEPEVREPDDSIEEILIEGTRTSKLKMAPISGTEFDAGSLSDLRIKTVSDLAAYTPNLEINTAFAASNPTLFVRGIGLKDYNANAAGAVAIYQDGIYINSPAAQLFQLFDIESVEVRRGPQGVLNGRNATAGSILVNTVKPDGEWSSLGSLSYGNYNSIELDAAIGFPIFADFFKDTLSGRIAGIANFADGYTKNRCADWDPAAEGFLPVTDQTIQDTYAALQPSPDRVFLQKDRVGPGGNTRDPDPKYIYQNLELVQQLSALNAASIGTKKLDEPYGDLQVGDVVGVASELFTLKPDGVCLLKAPGRVVTGEGAESIEGDAGSYTPFPNEIRLEEFQGLNHFVNDTKQWALRGLLRWQPTETLDFLFNAHWGQNRGGSFHLQSVGADPTGIPPDVAIVDRPLGYNQAENSANWDERNTQREATAQKRGLSGTTSNPDVPGVAGSDPFQGFYNRDGLEKLDVMGFSLNAEWDFGFGTLTWLTGYEENQRLVEDEGDGCPCVLLEADYRDESSQVSSELRATGGDVGYRWTAGGYVIYESLESNNLYRDSLAFQISQTFNQNLTAWYLYGSGGYDFILDGDIPGIYKLSLDGGVRYNWERKKFGLNTFFLRSDGSTPTVILDPSVEENVWEGVTGDVTLSYNPIPDAKLYTKFSRGMKSGHFNAGVTVETGKGTPRQTLSPVEPEFINAFEVGLKSSWWDDRIDLSAAFFRYWYTDLQVFDIVNEVGAIPTQQLLNADADVLGAELEVAVTPITGLLVQAGFAWLDSKFREFQVRKQVNTGFGKGQPGQSAVFDYEGNPLIAAPKFSLSGIVEYEIPLSRWGSLVPRFDFSWKSRTNLDPSAEDLISQPAYALLNARLAYRTPGGHFEIAGWVQNFTDERYVVDVFDVSRQFRMVTEIYGYPRSYGVTTSYDF